MRFMLGYVLILLTGCGADLNKDSVEDAGLDLSEQEVKTFASPLLQTYQTCEQLGNDLKEAALNEMRTRLAMKLNDMPEFDYGVPGCVDMMPMPVSGSLEAAPVSAAPREGVDFSGTNNQERGVDEADIVKTDGKYFYILNEKKLEIVRIDEQGGLVTASVLSLESPGDSILLMNDTAFVLSSNHWQEIRRADLPEDNANIRAPLHTSVTRVDVINLGADRTDPQLVETYYFQGEFLAARKIGKSIHVASFLDNAPLMNYSPELPAGFFERSHEEKTEMWAQALDRAQRENEALINGFDFLEMLPTKLTKNENEFIRTPLSEGDCAQAFSARDGSSIGFLNLITIVPEEIHTSIAMQWVRGNRPIVYASPDQFILASPEHQGWWFYGREDLKDQTTIHRFKLSESDLPYYADSVRVPGVLHNSFSLSEYEGYLRVATTTGRERFFQLGGDLGDPQEENHVFILGDQSGQLEIVSSLEGLAPGEKIWSARFSKDKGFLVTFRQVDPLFTLDLSDPKNPKVAGELKVPGVSTYLQDIGDGQLLAIGYGGDMDGLDFQTSVSMFDVTDFSSPQLADSMSFNIEENLSDDWARVSSEANRNHLAVNYFAQLGLTAIPVTTHRYVHNSSAPWNGHYEFITKLVLINTVAGSSLSVHGEVDHSRFYNAGRLDYFGSPEIRRSYFVGDYVYAISPLAVTATRLSDMETTGTHELN